MKIILLTVAKNGGAYNNITLHNTSSAFGLFPWSPSWGEINFRAFEMPTVEFHNELYGRLQETQNASREADIETYFDSKSIAKSKQWVRVNNGIVGTPYAVTKITYIRNSIHHPENTHNPIYTDAELTESIKEMIWLIENP